MSVNVECLGWYTDFVLLENKDVAATLASRQKGFLERLMLRSSTPIDFRVYDSTI